MRQFTYQAEQAQTLAAELRQRGYGESLLASLRHSDGVLVNGAPRRMIERVAPGDSITVTLPPERAELAPNAALQVPVLYEDEDIAVLDKPIDMLVHPAGRGFNDALGNFCAARWPERAFRPIGRLDRHTSGLVVAAQNRLAAALLTAGPLHKSYLALAGGVMPAREGRIEIPLARRGGRQVTYVPDAAGRPCITLYEVMEQYRGYSLLKLRLLTGRTHQIRAHLAALGCPLAGDALYGGNMELIPRQALHCHSARFIDLNGRPRLINSPLPADIQTALQTLRRSPSPLSF